MVLNLSIKSVFVKIKNSIYGTNVKEQNSLFQRDPQIHKWTFFDDSYIFDALVKSVITNKNLSFPKKLYEIGNKIFRQNCSSQEDLQIYCRAHLYRTQRFYFNCKKLYKKWKIFFCTKSMRNKNISFFRQNIRNTEKF